MLVLGPPGETVSRCLCSAQGHQHEQQSDLQYLLLVLGLEEPRQGQPENQGQLLVLGLGQLRERYGGMPMPDAAYMRF